MRDRGNRTNILKRSASLAHGRAQEAATIIDERAVAFPLSATAHRVGLVLVSVCALVLAACSGPQRQPEPAPAPVPSPPRAPTPPPTSSRPADVTTVPDAIPRVEPRSKRGNGPFYTVLGKRYTVLPSAEGYLERGVASWYGPTFHGKSTSNGEQYNQYAMTAAHKTLPLPAYARVTNLRNGKSIVVRVNDRGPFHSNRIIDLSYTAAAKLDMLREGTTLVEVKALIPGESDKLTRANESPPQTLYMQVGAFAQEDNARALVARLNAAGITNTLTLSPADGRSNLFRVRVGPIGTVDQFDALAAKLSRLGITDPRLATD